MSADVISMDAHKDALVQDRLEAYQAAARKAQQTLTVEDCLAAGIAWRRWLDLFESTEQRRASVIFREFGRRGDAR